MLPKDKDVYAIVVCLASALVLIYALAADSFPCDEKCGSPGHTSSGASR